MVSSNSHTHMERERDGERLEESHKAVRLVSERERLYVVAGERWLREKKKGREDEIYIKIHVHFTRTT